ncbi:MAG: DUF721 domain-containing protein [Candidatus Berkelbacteria bacterium]|nr:DUF721 domain-containing protein [Candidatus Berkelbacteria bacterium]
MKNENIKNILNRRLAHYGLSRTIDAMRICEVAGKVAAGEFEPISFRRGNLKIKVKSPAKAHLLRLGQGAVLEKINKELGEELVKRIVFKIEG